MALNMGTCLRPLAANFSPKVQWIWESLFCLAIRAWVIAFGAIGMGLKIAK